MNFKKVFNEVTVQSSLITIAFIIICLAAYFVTVPLIDYEVLNLILRDFNDSNIINTKSNFSVFALGVKPLLIAFITVKLISTIVIKINKKQENKKYIYSATLILTTILIVVQSIGISYYLKSLKYYGETIRYLVSPDLNHYLFSASIALSFLVGSFSLIFLAYKLDKKLIINGYILLLLIQYSVAYGPKTFKNISSFFTDAKLHISSYSESKELIEYELKEEAINKPKLLNSIDKNIKEYLSGLDKLAKYNRVSAKIKISAKKETINKIKVDFSEQHSLKFIEESQKSLYLSEEMIKNAKDLPEGIEVVKNSFTYYKTGETRNDYYFKIRSTSKEDKKKLDNFIKTVKLPKEYKVFYQIVTSSEESYFRTFILKKDSPLSGLLIEEVESLVDPKDNSPYVSLAFNEEGKELFAQITGELKGYRLAIIVDGFIDSAPIVQDRITGGRASITLGTGSYQERIKEAEKLKRNLRISKVNAFIK